MNNTVDIITGRKTFILNTNDNRPIEQLGFTCIQSDIEEDEIILTVNVKDEGDNFITVTDSDYPGYISVFYSRLIDENIYNFCISSSGFNKAYQDMVNFTKKREYQYFALSSWNTNFKDDNDNAILILKMIMIMLINAFFCCFVLVVYSDLSSL